MSKSAKYTFIDAYFEEWENTLKRAEFLTDSEKFHLEGVTVLLCHIAALGRGRYPDLKDRKSFKAVVKEYSGKYDLFENIDLLFLIQHPHSKVSEDPVYKKLANYDEILTAIENSIGTEEQIRENDSLRYQKRENLLEILKQASIPGFNVKNFETYIELFSNNQILYEFARCEAVHNRDFPLINIGTTFPDMQKTYTPNHQIDSEVLIETLSGIIENLKIECLKKEKWPHEL
ncbi:MAG: hypothetical protein ACQEV6_13540 [Pseudomonadota bacterium]